MLTSRDKVTRQTWKGRNLRSCLMNVGREEGCSLNPRQQALPRTGEDARAPKRPALNE